MAQPDQLDQRAERARTLPEPPPAVPLDFSAFRRRSSPSSAVPTAGQQHNKCPQCSCCCSQGRSSCGSCCQGPSCSHVPGASCSHSPGGTSTCTSTCPQGPDCSHQRQCSCSCHGSCSPRKHSPTATSPSIDLDLAGVFVKEEPADVEPAAFGAFGDGPAGPALAIACVAGNADEQWRLHSTLDVDAEVKTEASENYYDFDDESEEDQDVDAGAEYSSMEPEPVVEPALEPAEPRLPPEVEMLETPQREFELVDLEAEWAERESPPRASTAITASSDSGHLRAEQPPLRVVVKEESHHDAGVNVGVKQERQRGLGLGSLGPSKGECTPCSTTAKVKKEERDLVDEEAGRDQLFGKQDFPDDGEEELVADDDKQAERAKEAELSDTGRASGPRSGHSTTLYPAVPPDQVAKMRAHVAKIVKDHNDMTKDLWGSSDKRGSSSSSSSSHVSHKSRRHHSSGEKQKRRSSLDASSSNSTPSKRVKRDTPDSPPKPSVESEVVKKAAPKVRAAQAPAPASVKKRRLQGVKEDCKEEPKDEPLSPPPLPPPKSKKAFAGPLSVKSRRMLPVLPAAQHLATQSPVYEGRSPLYVEDEAPRKSYSAGPMTESSESKGVIRAAARASWLDNVLFQICKWKPEWLRAAKRISSKKVPTLLPNMERFDDEKTDLEFGSVEEYLNHFQDGLLLELWEMLRKDYRDRQRPPKTYVTAVESCQDKILLANKRRRTLKCHCGTDQKTPLRLGDLVIVSPIGKSSEPAKPHFAYIEVAGRNRVVSDSEKLSIHLQEHFEIEPDFKFDFKLTVCTDDYPETVPKVFVLEKLKNLYEEVELFKFLTDFALHNMSPLILQPKYAVRPEPAFGLKTGGDLHPLTQKPVMLSVIQDIVDYEAPSLSVVEGGPGTGKTHLVAALAQELVERKHKLHRDCYVVIAAKSVNQLDGIIQKLHSRNALLTDDPKNRDPDAFRAVWLGNDKSPHRGAEVLMKNSLRKLGEKHVLKQNTEPLERERKQLIKDISKNEHKLKKLTNKNYNFPELASNTAKMKLQLTLLNEQIEKNSSQLKDQNTAMIRVLEKCDILLTTFSCNYYRSAAREALLKTNPRKHVVLIIDDASEVLEPIVIKLMVLFGITDIVLFGDTRQHTPYVSSKWARNAGLVVPLMKRYTLALKEAHCLPAFRSLTRQIRLHPDILRGINKTFYDDTMKPSKYIEGGHIFHPYVWFNCTYFDNKVKDETEFIIKLLLAVLKVHPHSTPKGPIRVISFSKDISARLASTDYGPYCETGDSITSMEYDTVILSIGPSTRLRVDRTVCALTRARKSLFICGNLQDTSPKFLSLFRDARELKCTEDVTDRGISVEKILKRIRI